MRVCVMYSIHRYSGQRKANIGPAALWIKLNCIFHVHIPYIYRRSVGLQLLKSKGEIEIVPVSRCTFHFSLRTEFTNDKLIYHRCVYNQFINEFNPKIAA